MIGRNAPSEVREVWQNAYTLARDYYTAERAPSPDNIARNTAWKTVKMFWEEPKKGRFRMRNPTAPVIAGEYRGETIFVGEEQPMPTPGRTAGICKLLELTWIAADGNLQVQRFQEPGLPDVFWNRRTKILYMFPDVELGPGQCVVDVPRRQSHGRRLFGRLADLFSPLEDDESDVFIGLEDQVEMYRIWSKRDPRCRHELMVPEDDIVAFGVADTIVYRSDKWEDEPNPHPDKLGSQEYLHQYGLDVAIEETPENPPAAIVIRGGKLDVLEGGIAH